MRKIICPCSNSVEHNGTGNVGAIINETGHLPVFGDDGSCTWFCSECALKLKPHIEAIVKIANGNNYLNWRQLMRFAEKVKE